MNPEIDLSSFRRDRNNTAPPNLADSRLLVSPPRRVLTRYVLPLTLISAFAAICAYAARDAFLPAVDVQIVQPVIAGAAAALADPNADAPAEVDSKSEITKSDSGAAPNQSASSTAAASAAPSPAASTPLFQAPGWIEPEPFPTIVSALIPGIVARVNVREGQQIPAGEIVAELDDGDARVAVRKAEANLQVRQAELDAALANWDNPIALEETTKTATAEMARLRAERTRTQRQMEFSRKQADVSRNLGLSGAEGKLSAEKASVDALVAEATLSEIDAKIDSQAASLQAAERKARLRLEDKSRLALAKAQVEEATAVVEESKLRLRRCRVVAPTSGTVMRLHATPGAMISMDVQNGTHIISMYDPNQLQVRAEIPLADAGKIQIGLPAEIRVEAMPDKVFRGELIRVVHEADVQRNSLPVKVRVLDPDPTLKPEMVARLQFNSIPRPSGAQPADAETRGNHDNTTPGESLGSGGLFVPESLIPADTKSDAHLWVVGADMHAHTKAITLGQARRGKLREVTAGLEPSDKLIATNIEKLKEGSRVRIVAFDQEGTK